MIETATDYHGCVESSTYRELADRIFSLCQDGRLEAARNLLVAGDDPDLIFSAGLVEYWSASIGHGSFEAAKNTLTRAGRLFSEAQDFERQLLCNIYLGLCYSRQGQSAEATVLVDTALMAAGAQTRYLAWLSKAVLELENQQWEAARVCLEKVTPLVETQPCSLQGRFYLQRALIHRKSGATDAALVDYEQALVCFEEVDNREFMARVYNNLAWLYIAIDPESAHRNIDPAITIQRSIGNWPELAQCLDTRALIFLHERKLREARSAIEEALTLLGANDHQLHFPDFLVTRGRILAESGFPEDASRDFFQAAEIEEANENPEAARRVYRQAIEALCIAVGRKRFNSPLRTSGREQEAKIIKSALQKCNGSIAKAAQLIDIPRTTLIGRINTHHRELLSLTRTERRRSILRK